MLQLSRHSWLELYLGRDNTHLGIAGGGTQVGGKSTHIWIALMWFFRQRLLQHKIDALRQVWTIILQGTRLHKTMQVCPIAYPTFGIIPWVRPGQETKTGHSQGILI